MQEKYRWPPGSTLTFSTAKRKPWLTSHNRALDLADTLMLYWPHHSRTAYMTAQLKKSTTKWSQWDEETLGRIESIIRDDLYVDAYRVRITRMTAGKNSPCTDAFRWKLNIQPIM